MNLRVLLIASSVGIAITTPSFAQEAPFVRDVFARINAERVQHGLKPCTYNGKLEKAAQFHAEWMARNEKMEHLEADEEPTSVEHHKTCTFHHINRAIKAGYRSWDDFFFVENRPDGQIVQTRPDANEQVSEIIAAGWNAGHPMSHTKVVVDGWMRSPGHRKEVLTGFYEEMGIGVSCTPENEYDTFWCVVFGDPVK
jgi:uncharacterized protein YkwD